MKMRYLRAGGQNATPAAVLKIRYRDLDSLISRGIVHSAHQPKWLEEYRNEQIRQAADAQR
jgi:acyl-CoA thioesterase FadM